MDLLTNEQKTKLEELYKEYNQLRDKNNEILQALEQKTQFNLFSSTPENIKKIVTENEENLATIETKIKALEADLPIAHKFGSPSAPSRRAGQAAM